MMHVMLSSPLKSIASFLVDTSGSMSDDVDVAATDDKSLVTGDTLAL